MTNKNKVEKGKAGISALGNIPVKDSVSPSPQILTAKEEEMAKNGVPFYTYKQVRKVIKNYYVHKKKVESALKEIDDLKYPQNRAKIIMSNKARNNLIDEPKKIIINSFKKIGVEDKWKQ